MFMGKNKIKKKRDEKKRVGELWLVLIVCFIIAIAGIVSQKSDGGLQKEAEIILNELTNGDEHNFAVNKLVQDEVLTKISGMSYTELKDSLNIENDFCIYFEDENGNLVEVKDGLRSVGSDAIELNGRPCGE